MTQDSAFKRVTTGLLWPTWRLCSISDVFLKTFTEDPEGGLCSGAKQRLQKDQIGHFILQMGREGWPKHEGLIYVEG